MRSIWLGLIAVLSSSTVTAKSRDTKTYPPPEPGWERVSYWPPVGKVDVRREGPFIVDKRPLESAKALEACRRFGANALTDNNITHAAACELFLYPSMRDMPGARDAIAIYERQFATARTAAERVSLAIDQDYGVDWELPQNANPSVLNSFVSNGSNGEAATVAEKFAFRNAWRPDKIQWLFDRGARFCESDSPPGKKRFSCIQFYLNADSSRMTVGGVNVTPKLFETLDVLERNGFRPKSKNEIEAAVSWSDVVGSEGQGKRRYYALLSQADARRVQSMASQRRGEREAAFAAEQRAQQERERQALIRSSGAKRRSEAENGAAVRRLAIRGETVCQMFTENGAAFMFRAVVEGNSATRLQLRASSIRSSSQEIAGYPYGDTRINPGTVFWDDAANWDSNC